MAEVQAQPIQQRSSKQKVSLDGFLACGGKIGKDAGEDDKSPEAMMLNVCGDGDIDALLAAAKNDKLPAAPTTPVKRGKVRSSSVRKNKVQDQPNGGLESKSAHLPKPRGVARAMSTDATTGKTSNKKTTIKHSQSFDKTKLIGDAGLSPTKKNSKLNQRKAAMQRSKSFDGDTIPLKRIPRNAPRGEPTNVKTRDKLSRQSSNSKRMGEKQSSRRRLSPDGKQSSEAKLKRTSSSDNNKVKAANKPRSRSAKRPSGSKKAATPDAATPPAPAAVPPAPALNRQVTNEIQPHADLGKDMNAFDATFGCRESQEEKTLPLTLDDSDSDSDSECEGPQQDLGIIQFDPTATDNVVMVRQDSGAFPSCPVCMDISDKNNLNKSDHDHPHSHTPANTPAAGSLSPRAAAAASQGWGKFFGTNSSKLKTSNSFKMSRNTNHTNTNNDGDETPTATSMFNSLFSGNHNTNTSSDGDDTPTATSMFNSLFNGNLQFSGAQTHQQLDDDMDISLKR